MSENEKCPFCGTWINPGATTCTGCLAYKGVNAERYGLLFFVLVGGWILMGPVLLWASLTGDDWTAPGRVWGIVTSLFFTWGGWKAVKGLLFTPVWMRQR